MHIPKEKVKVFISSACGDEPEKQKYNYIREALRALINSLGFAETYVFESEGASSVSAELHYKTALESSDICIFIIDNRDGIPDGVLAEIHAANKYHKKSLYYFCDQFSKEETPLQKSLKGAKYAKSTTIHEFKDIIEKCPADLVNEIIIIYKQYCKGNLNLFQKTETGQNTDVINIGTTQYIGADLRKDLFLNVDCCIKYFIEIIFGGCKDVSEDISKTCGKTGNIDKYCAKFLPVLFEQAPYNDADMQSLLSEIEKYQEPLHYEVTKIRYEAIKEYFSGDLDSCIKKMNEAYELAKSNSLESWLISDILIDMRNLESFCNERDNNFFIETESQKKLNNNKTLVHYPVLDRLKSNYYEAILDEMIKNETRKPETVTLYSSDNLKISKLAEIYVISMYYGSLTHILKIYENLNILCFHLSSKISNWNIKKTLLKTTIIAGNQKKTDEIIRCYEEILSEMDAEDAIDIYNFSNNCPINYMKFNSNLDAFRITAYYLNDADFASVWNSLYDDICKWVQSKNAVVKIGSNIFSALKQSHLRIPQNQLLEIICNTLINKKERFYNDVFDLIQDGVNFKESSEGKIIELLDLIIEIIRDSEVRSKIRSLEPALYSLRKECRDLTDALDKVIAQEMPEFYNGVYRLETTDNEKKDLPEFIESCVKLIHKDNSSHNTSTIHLDMSYAAHTIIKNILTQSTVEFSTGLIDSVFQVACETLLCEHRTIGTKMDAIELLIYLINTQNNIKERNSKIINKVLSNKNSVTKSITSLTNLNETNLNISVLMLYSCLDKDVVLELMESLAIIGDDILSNKMASSLFVSYLETKDFETLDARLKQIIVQKTIEWCSAANTNIRWNAVQLLFILIDKDKQKYTDIVCNQLVKFMDNDNVYIKKGILMNIYLLKNVDYATYNYIIQKALLDTNYVIRDAASDKNEND